MTAPIIVRGHWALGGEGCKIEPVSILIVNPERMEDVMFVQLEPTIPVHVIDKGDGYAFAVIDYGQEHNLIWVTAINETGEIWCAPNPRVRMAKNWTMGRTAAPDTISKPNI